MEVLLMGGVGTIGSVVCRELLETTDAEIVIGDNNFNKAKKFASSLKSKRVSAKFIDAGNKDEVVSFLKDIDLLANCTNIRDHHIPLDSAIEAGVNYLDITGSLHRKKLELNEKAKQAGITALLAIGASPGVTNVLTRHAANELDQVEEIQIDFIAYRPMSVSAGLLDTFLHQFLEEEKERCYYKDGRYIPVPPFSGERTIYLPEPLNAQKTYFMAHAETHMLSRSFKDVKFVATRGTWPPNLMEAARTFTEYHLFSNKPIQIKEISLTPREFLREHLLLNEKKYEEKIFGLFNYVEVVGVRDGKRMRKINIVTHPEEWKSESVQKVTGINAAVGAAMLLRGEIIVKGVFTPENAIEPSLFIDRIKKRGLKVIEKNEYQL